MAEGKRQLLRHCLGTDWYIPYSRFFSLVKYFVSQILAGSNFRHRASVRKLNSDKNLIMSKIIFGLNTCNNYIDVVKRNSACLPIIALSSGEYLLYFPRFFEIVVADAELC